MIKLIIFDLDGVLADCKHIHFEALNKAIEEVAGHEYTITESEHLSSYDGLPTFTKLSKLTEKKHLSTEHYAKIQELKQKYTEEMLETLPENPILYSALVKLSIAKPLIQFAVCSNARRATVEKVLHRLKIGWLMSAVYSNDDVAHPKPHAEIYLLAMVNAGVNPYETLIFEDSPVGLEGASRAAANIAVICESKDLTYDFIESYINKFSKPPSPMLYSNTELNIIIPMAGNGSRFKEAGYALPKFLIPIDGVPMIDWVVYSLHIQAKFTFICQNKDYQKYNLGTYLKSICGPKTRIISLFEPTEGAAQTVLMAEPYINGDEPVMVVNSDQYIEWNPIEFFYKAHNQRWDAGILSFPASGKKWSYVKLNSDGFVEEVAEKKEISNLATVGVYWNKKASDLFKYVKQMMAKNIRTNGEFYFAPSYNEMLLDNKKIGIYNVKMHGLGTPDDLQKFIEQLHKNET